MTPKRNLRRSHLPSLISVATIVLVTILFSGSQNCAADEIQISSDSSETIVGDFRCKPCDRAIFNDSECFEMNSGSLTTGDLYRYFQSRGITNIDRLSLQVDVNCSEEDLAFQLDELNFTISGDDDTILTNVSMRENSLSVPGSEISSFKPEAILEFDLGYNFMERYSSESTEAIILDYKLPSLSSGMTPRFVVSEDISSFTFSNLGFLVLFITFWIGVFLLMNIFARRQTETPSTANGAKLARG